MINLIVRKNDYSARSSFRILVTYYTVCVMGINARIHI